MTGSPDFNGFPIEAVQFFIQLRQNNQREWFRFHQADYERFVMQPARDFVIALGTRLKQHAPGIHADPRTDRSIFRIYRDTRFSPDKSPYKTNLGIWFWEGEEPKMESSGFYFHLEPPMLMLAVGMYQFSGSLLETYRQAVLASDTGSALEAAIQAAQITGKYTLGGKHYKRMPKGVSPDQPRAEYLLYNGLHVGMENEIPPEFYSSELLDTCTQVFQDLLPLHRWLMDLIEFDP